MYSTCQCTLCTVPANVPYVQYLPMYPMYSTCQCTLCTVPANAPYVQYLPMYPMYSTCQCTLCTVPANVPYVQYLPMHPMYSTCQCTLQYGVPHQDKSFKTLGSYCIQLIHSEPRQRPPIYKHDVIRIKNGILPLIISIHV